MAPVRVVVDSYDSYLHLCTAIDDDDDDDDGDDDNFDFLWKKFNTSVGERLMTKIITSSRRNLPVSWINWSVYLFSIEKIV